MIIIFNLKWNVIMLIGRDVGPDDKYMQ